MLKKSNVEFEASFFHKNQATRAQWILICHVHNVMALCPLGLLPTPRFSIGGVLDV